MIPTMKYKNARVSPLLFSIRVSRICLSVKAISIINYQLWIPLRWKKSLFWYGSTHTISRREIPEFPKIILCFLDGIVGILYWFCCILYFCSFVRDGILDMFYSWLRFTHIRIRGTFELLIEWGGSCLTLESSFEGAYLLIPWLIAILISNIRNHEYRKYIDDSDEKNDG